MEQLTMDDNTEIKGIYDIDTTWITDNVSTVTIDTDTLESDYTITIDEGGGHTVAYDGSWADNINWQQTEFKDCMPNLLKVEQMCKHYPALEKAFENFKAVYSMVHQDYKGLIDAGEEKIHF